MKTYTNTRITDLINLKYPISAIASIIHRVSGLIMFLYTPLVMYILSLSISGQYGYNKAMELSKSFVLYPLLFSIFFHLLAGIRHVIMDMGFLEERLSSKITAFIVILSATLLTIGYILV